MDMESTEDAGEKNSHEQSNEETTGDDYETLKYHLLGPSLTKAGQDAVDQKKVQSASLDLASTW